MSFRLGNLIPRVSAHGERDLFAWSLLAAVILLALLAMPFFAGGLYTVDELGNFHLSARAFYAQQLARGEAFDWMPDANSAHPEYFAAFTSPARARSAHTTPCTASSIVFWPFAPHSVGNTCAAIR